MRTAVMTLCLAMLLAGVAVFAADDKKPDETPKTKGAIPANWKALNLTVEQKDRVYKVHADFKVKEDKLAKEIKDLKDAEYKAKVDVLTDEQKKKLAATIIPDDKPAKDKEPEKPKDK